ncbi:MAG TPA: hypothetical protein VGK99_09555 [Acidobacteriota bacterium]|jgi:hypothetical protein
MLRKVSLAIVALGLCISLAKADFHYKETTKLEGGMLGGMVKIMGRLGGQKIDDVPSAIYIKGDRLRREDPTHIQLIRLDKEDFVDINLKEKTYTILTFEQMRAQFDEANRKMRDRRPSNQDPNVTLKMDFKESGKTDNVAGYSAKEYIMELRMRAEDKEKNQSAETVMNGSVWLTKDVQGYDQVRDFYQKFGQKFGRVFAGMGQAMANNPQFGEALQKFAAKAHAMNGAPVLTVITFSAVGDPNAQAQQGQQPQAKEGEGASVPSLGKIFGGFGRKKKEDKKAESQPESSAQPPAGGLVLFKSRTESRDFSNSPVDSSLFDIPAGYRQISKQ